jgi:AraC-like DNA-binding protein
LLFESRDAGSIAHSVGYESASQFSREYARMFGMPPRRDAARYKVAAFANDQALVSQPQAETGFVRPEVLDAVA